LVYSNRTVKYSNKTVSYLLQHLPAFKMRKYISYVEIPWYLVISWYYFHDISYCKVFNTAQPYFSLCKLQTNDNNNYLVHLKRRTRAHGWMGSVEVTRWPHFGNYSASSTELHAAVVTKNAKRRSQQITEHWILKYNEDSIIDKC